jgi:aspartyl-tRNA synthetase
VLDFLGNLKRTHYCGARCGQTTRDTMPTVMAAVSLARPGEFAVLDIRDRAGIVQVVFNNSRPSRRRTQKRSRRAASLARLR